MYNNSCRAQIMGELLRNNKVHEIADDCFLNVKRDYFTCLKLLWIEEKWNIVSDNFYEWEEEIKNSYDFLLLNYNECNVEYGKREIIILNRRLFNVLSSIRMYRDQVLKDLSDLDNELKKEFENETHAQYDKTFSYQIMEFIRNYMQHQGLVIERITMITPFSMLYNPLFNTTKMEHLLYFAEADYWTIRKIPKYEQKIKNRPEAEEKIRWINLIGLLREYYNQYLDLHHFFRDITKKISDAAIAYIEQTIKNIYVDMPINEMGFYGKKDSQDFQDFLLQITYIEQLKKYREKDIPFDTTRYYISKKCFLSSDGVKVTNSERVSIRYNK